MITGIINLSLLSFLFLFSNFSILEATTPAPTLPPTTMAPLNEFFAKYAASQHRQNKMLDVKPLAVVEDVSRVECLSLCLQRQFKSRSRSCRSFNFSNRTCYMLNTFLCDGERELMDAPGYFYFDLVDDYTKENEFLRSKQCEAKGKCSSKCRKFKLIKTPLSWEEAHAACRQEQAFLAMPRNARDHETLVALIRKGNTLQSWIGVRKRKGIFYYDNDELLGNFTVWGPEQPNDSGGTQQCVQMMNEMDYMWNDFDCARPVGFVCQYVW